MAQRSSRQWSQESNMCNTYDHYPDVATKIVTYIYDVIPTAAASVGIKSKTDIAPALRVKFSSCSLDIIG